MTLEKNSVAKTLIVREFKHVSLENAKNKEAMMTMKAAEYHVVKITNVKEINPVSLENVRETKAKVEAKMKDMVTMKMTKDNVVKITIVR